MFSISSQLQPFLPSITTAQNQQTNPISPKPIPSIPPSHAAAALTRAGGGYRLLDVRPPWEREKAWVKNSLHVPLFIEDPASDPLTLVKKSVHFGYIGLWTGHRFTALNRSFVSEVDSVVPAKDAKLLVACGEGLRSIVAVKKLREAGYGNLAWLAGGFNGSGEGDFDGLEGNGKLKYAAVGGLSYFLLQLLLLLKVVQ